MFNASPLTEGETEEDRHWSVLLLINATTGKVTVVPGYAAEVWLSNDQWGNALSNMNDAWQRACAGEAVAAFINTAKKMLDVAWHHQRSATKANYRP